MCLQPALVLYASGKKKVIIIIIISSKVIMFIMLIRISINTISIIIILSSITIMRRGRRSKPSVEHVINPLI